MKLLETFVYISAKDEALKTGLKNASRVARKEVSDMQKMFDSLSFKSLNMRNLIMGAAGLWGAKQAIDNLVGSTVKLGSAYNDMAARTGVSVENLSALGHAAKLTGADTESLEKSLRQLTNNMLDTARGTGAARQTFKELNIGVQDARGNLRPTVDVMMQFADAIKGMTDETKQAAYASELFGARTGTKLLPMLKQGSAGLREMMEEAKRLGITMSTEEAAAADELGDTMDRLTGAMEGVKRAIVIGVIPAITDIVKRFTEWIVANRELIKANVSEWVNRIAAGLKLVWDHRETIKTAFEVAAIALITTKLIALWEILSKISGALVVIGSSKAFGIMAGSGLAAGAATTGIGLGAAATVYGGKRYADATTAPGFLPGLPYASTMATRMPIARNNDPYGIVRLAESFKNFGRSGYAATSLFDNARAVSGIGGPSGSVGSGGSNIIPFRGYAGLGTSGLPMVNRYQSRDWEYQTPGIGQFGAGNWEEIADTNKKEQEKLREQWAEYLVDITILDQNATQKMIDNAVSFGTYWGDTMISLYEQSDKSFAGIVKSFSKMIQQMILKATVSGLFAFIFSGGNPAAAGAAMKASMGIPTYGTGGTAYKPTLAMIGDTGPERVLNPIETRAYERGAGKAVAYTDNSSITIQFPGNVSGATASELAVQLDRIIRERKSGEIEKLRRGVA